MPESYRDLLGSLDHLDQLEAEQIEALIEIVEPRTLVSGNPLWSPGEEGEAGYLLVSGRVEMTWRAPQQGRQQRQFAQPGSWLGLSYLVAGWEHESSAYPLERSEVLEIRRDRFLDLFDRKHPAAFRLADVIAEKLVEEVRDANDRLHEVFGHPAETLRMLRRRTADESRP